MSPPYIHSKGGPLYKLHSELPDGPDKSYPPCLMEYKSFVLLAGQPTYTSSGSLAETALMELTAVFQSCIFTSLHIVKRRTSLSHKHKLSNPYTLLWTPCLPKPGFPVASIPLWIKGKHFEKVKTVYKSTGFIWNNCIFFKCKSGSDFQWTITM